MGEVYKPEDVIAPKRKASDLSPGLGEITSSNLHDIIREIEILKTEVKKIKQVLRSNGIFVD